MSDLDLLVRFEKSTQALETLKYLGYTGEDYSYWSFLRPIFAQNYHLQMKEGGIVELHWKLLRKVRSAQKMTEWAWAETKLVEDCSQYNSSMNDHPQIKQSKVLSTSANLFYLSSHLLIKHGTARGQLLWLYDIHALLSTPKVVCDWENIHQYASEFSLNCVILALFEQLEVFFQTSYPAWLIEKLNEHEEEHVRQLMSDMTQPHHHRGRIWWKSWQTLIWYEKILYMLGTVFPSPDFLKRRYNPKPAWLWPFYYIYRWGEILFEALKILLDDNQKGKSRQKR
jgi:hypothetical protein